jgi:protein-S-isoprenylcysteine O-methyltransferase Ste14
MFLYGFTAIEINSFLWFILFAFWLLMSLNTKRTVRRQSSVARSLYLIAVIAAFAILYYSAFSLGFLKYRLFNSTHTTEICGILLTALGIGWAIWSRIILGTNWSGTITIKDSHELITRGPYSITRHPIYTGFILGMTGGAVTSGELRGVLSVLLFFAALDYKSRMEEKLLMETFPQYADYRLKVRKLIPFLY